MPISMVLLIRQFSPLRIDHHGWQVVAATALLALSLGQRSGRKGIVAGLVMAFYLSISLEALPYFLLFGALYAWGYWRSAAQWPMLLGFLTACAAGTMVSLPASRGWEALTITHCDGLSAPYWSALAAASAAMLLGARLIGHAAPARRFTLLAATGAAALAAFLLVAPQCSSGPFAALDPLVRQYWYLNVLEGLPITAQVPLIALYSIIPTALGLLGSWLAIRRVAEPLRGDWRVLLVLQIGAAAISIWVLRALYVSHAFAVPGCAYLALATWQRARTIEKVPARVLASVAVVLAVPAVPLAIVSKLDEAAAANASNAMTPVLNPCFRKSRIAGLNRIAPTVLFAPIDLGPAILTDTAHSVIATGHHRNQAAMAKVIGAFLGDEKTARRLVTGSQGQAAADLSGYRGDGRLCQGRAERPGRAAGQGRCARLADPATARSCPPVPRLRDPPGHPAGRSGGGEVHRRAVHAIALAGGLGAVVEDMAQMPAAARAFDFGAGNADAGIAHRHHRALQRRVEARPAGAAFELGLAAEQLLRARRRS